MPPLEIAFSGSVGGYLVLEETQALMGATRLASEFFQRPIVLVLAFPVVAVSEVPIILS